MFQKLQKTPPPMAMFACIFITFLLTRTHFEFARWLTQVLQLNSSSHHFWGNSYLYIDEESSIYFILSGNLFVHYHNILVSLWDKHTVMPRFIYSYWINYQCTSNNWIARFQHITFMYIKIFEIHQMAFVGIHCLLTLRLEETSLRTMPPLAPLKSTLEQLLLFYNNISFVPRNNFLGFRKLHTLNMRGNNLCVIPDITPLRHILIHIQLNGNKLRTISSGLIGIIYSHLKFISLSNNEIHTFDWDMMSFWSAIHGIYLYHNHIASLPTSYPMYGDRNCSGDHRDITVDLRWNPMHCGEAVRLIINNKTSHGAKMNPCVTITDLNHMVCASPTELRGRNLDELGM